MYDVISKTNGRNKVIDFRNNLVLAKLDDYATIHGSGGKNYNSTIRCTICDFSKGTGDSSVTVGVNFDINIIYTLYEMAKQYAVGGDGTAITAKGIMAMDEARNKLRQLYTAVSQQKQLDQKFVEQIGVSLNSAIQEIKTYSDYIYNQDKINVHNKNANGIAPVTRVMITHQAYRKDGQKSTYPWYIKITAGKAPVITKEGGATTFNSKELIVEGEAFINISDADMYKMLQRVVRFIEVWETSTYIPLLRNALDKKEEARIAAANNRS